MLAPNDEATRCFVSFFSIPIETNIISITFRQKSERLEKPRWHAQMLSDFGHLVVRLAFFDSCPPALKSNTSSDLFFFVFNQNNQRIIRIPTYRYLYSFLQRKAFLGKTSISTHRDHDPSKGKTPCPYTLARVSKWPASNSSAL